MTSKIFTVFPKTTRLSGRNGGPDGEPIPKESRSVFPAFSNENSKSTRPAAMHSTPFGQRLSANTFSNVIFKPSLSMVADFAAATVNGSPILTVETSVAGGF